MTREEAVIMRTVGHIQLSIARCNHNYRIMLAWTAMTFFELAGDEKEYRRSRAIWEALGGRLP